MALNQDHESDEDIDAILAELEAETDETDAAYQQRLQDLQNASKSSSGLSQTPTGQQRSCVVLTSDDETLHFTTEHETAVVHFRHPDFARCEIMDVHIDRIANRHAVGEASGDGIVFAKVDVADAPFVVEKLGVRILPCVIGFEKGIVKGKVVGFEGICWDNKEKDPKVSRSLEALLVSWGLLRQKLIADDHDTESEDDERETNGSHDNVRRGIKTGNIKNVTEDDDWD